MPRLVQTATIRFGVCAACAAASNRAGHMASKNGRASETPAPRRKARRESGMVIIGMILLGLENWALHDFVDERPRAPALLFHFVDDRRDRRAIGKPNPRPRRVGDKLARERGEHLVGV